MINPNMQIGVNEMIKAELKVDLIILLAENDYPPVDRDGCIRKF